MSIVTIILGLILIVLGVLGLKYNYQITENFGSFSSLEGLLGPGNEYAIFKILALILIIIGFITMFGVYDEVLTFLLSPLRTLFNPSIEA